MDITRKQPVALDESAGISPGSPSTDALADNSGSGFAPPSENPQQDSTLADPALRERMRKLAQRPRGPRKNPRIATPAWLRRLDDEVAEAERNPQYVKALRELRAELAELEGGKPSETLIKATARQTALVAYLDAATFSAGLNGGVNRRTRRLHDLVEQRSEQYAALLSLRRRLGLDAESVMHAQTFSDAFKQLVEEGDSDVDHAQVLREARERAACMGAELATQAAAVEPAALLEGPANPSTTVPEPVPAPDSPAPVLELAQDEPRKPEAVVEDLGHVRTRVLPPAAPAPAPEPYERPISPEAAERARDMDVWRLTGKAPWHF